VNYLRIRAAMAAFAAVAFLASAAPAWSSSTVTNGILRITIENTTTDAYFGEFDVSTGPAHPQPNETVLYPFGTSFITLRDVGATTMWVNSDDPTVAGLAAYTLKNLNTDVTVTRTFAPIGTSGFRATWTMPNFTIQQDVVIVGTTLSDTRVDQQVTVTNTSGAPRQYGLRYMWDWQIAGNDGSLFRTRNPDGSFSSNTVSYSAPTFQYFEEVDSISTPTFSIFGSVLNSGTTPEILRYSGWGESDDSAWGYTDLASAAGDSSTVYFWGFNTPLTMAAGASASVIESISTQQSAIGGPVVSQQVPGPTGAALIPVALLVLLVAYWTLRRSARS
jgi:hypothetical protein